MCTSATTMDHGVANGLANGIAHGIANGIANGKNGMLLTGRNGVVSNGAANGKVTNGRTYRVYEVEEVEKHATIDDCWVIHQNNVYDVTGFLDTHPGGGDLILSYAGSDITHVLCDEGIHKHTSCAYNLLRDYHIGRVNRPQSNVEGEGAQEEGARECDMDMEGWNEDTVDWSRGLVFQVYKYGENYMKWVHSPVNRDLKLFDSNFIEFFSKTKWYMIPLVWIPVVIFCSFLACNHISTTMHTLYPTKDVNNENFLALGTFCVLFLAGIPLWTLMEYVLHRYLFHLEPNGNSPVMITIHFFFHGQHHKVPFDKDRLVFPPVAAGVFALMFWRVFNFILPGGIGASLCCGGMLGYIGYDLIHYYMHHGTPVKGSFMHDLKHYHVLHHFHDHNTGFGISTRFWDYPFNTVNKKLL